MNLATNARDAMPEGGTLSFTTRRVTVTARRTGVRPLAPGDYMLLEVRDTGTGIAAEIRSKIFDPFFTRRMSARAPDSASPLCTASSDRRAA
jgi:two-component system cell cycle sensor histidine kinase/response regulator CckA